MKPITLNRTIQDNNFIRLITQYERDNKGKSFYKKTLDALYEKQNWFCKNCIFFEDIPNLDEPYCSNEYMTCESPEQKGCWEFWRNE